MITSAHLSPSINPGYSTQGFAESKPRHMLSSTISQQRIFLVPHNKQDFLTCESSWFLEERVRSSFSLVSLLSNVWADFLVLHCAEENCELYLYLYFCLIYSQVDLSEDVNHQHRVKGGKLPCLSQVISNSLLLPHEIK